MEQTNLTIQEEKNLIEEFFSDSRHTLQDYFQERHLMLSNSQLFAFILISPITIAIASDGNLDLTETTMLVDIAAYFDRGILPSVFDDLGQPEGILSDKEFKKIIYSELRFLCLNMGEYEPHLIHCLKKLIELDEKVSNDTSPTFSIKKRVVEMMNAVIYNNLGVDEIEEAKVKSVLDQLGLNQ